MHVCRDWQQLQEQLNRYDAQRETIIKRSRGAPPSCISHWVTVGVGRRVGGEVLASRVISYPPMHMHIRTTSIPCVQHKCVCTVHFLTLCS
jgi:hypothetical protein